MHVVTSRWLTGLVAAFAACAVRAAYLESDADSTGTPLPEHPPRRVFPPDQPREHPLRRLLRDVRVGTPHSYGGLTVFPLIGPANRDANILTLDEALKRGWLVVREQDREQVPCLSVRNDAGQRVLLLAGEILLGGKQNRLVREDVLLPAHAGFIDVPVYCGEARRWEGSKPELYSSGSLAGSSLRGLAAAGRSQEAIWREIDDRLKAGAVSSSTRDYQALHEDAETRRRLDRYSSELHLHPEPPTVGLVVTRYDRILGCDLFSDSDLCSRLWDKILRSYLIEVVFTAAAPRLPAEWRPAPGPRLVQSFLARAAAADLTEGHTPGAGASVRLSGAVTGAALLERDRVVHAVVFDR